jgi:hypothetical protein
MDRLLQHEVFAKTAELNSLSKADEVLGMSNAAAISSRWRSGWPPGLSSTTRGGSG